MVRSICFTIEQSGQHMRRGKLFRMHNLFLFEVNLMVRWPVLIRKYNIPNSYVKRELFEVIHSFKFDYFSCRYFKTIIFNVWLIFSMLQSGTTITFLVFLFRRSKGRFQALSSVAFDVWHLCYMELVTSSLKKNCPMKKKRSYGHG